MIKQNIACSTMWNIRQHKNPVDALKEIKEIGFDFVELNYLVTKEMLEQMRPYLSEGNIAVSSIHNVFPKTDNQDYGTDSILLGYIDEVKRKEAVRLTKISIDYAAAFQAKACVIHPSEVPLSCNYDEVLKQLYKQYVYGKESSVKEQFDHLMKQFLFEKGQIVEQYLSQTVRSLYELSDYVSKKNYNIKIAIENRAMVHQLPTFLEAERLFNELKTNNIYLWYDTGHAIMMEELGLLEITPIIHKLVPKIAGAHIHDALNVEDHFTPYTFGNNFDRYIPILKDVEIIVFEVGPKCSKDDLLKSLNIIKERLKTPIRK